MTTNKPEVVAWIKETWRSATESRPVVHDWEGNGSVVSPLVRLSDYEALQAECKEEIYRALQYRDAHFGALLQAIEQVDAMKAECEELRKDAERYRWLRADNAYFPEENYIRGGQELDAANDAAMAGGDQ